jgi:hypothetical protein
MTEFANKHLVALIAVLCVMPAMTAPALAQGAGQGGGNIFTQPGSANQAPGFSEGGPGSRMRREWAGGREEFPDFRQVRNLPDLTPDQRKQVQQVMQQSKQQMGPIREQMQAMREKNQGGEQQLMGNPDTREKFMDLRRQMKEARKQSWEQMKKVLTDKQVQELQDMRQGQMQPSTFNPPMGSGFAGRHGRFQGGSPGQPPAGQQSPGGQDQPMPNSSNN